MAKPEASTQQFVIIDQIRDNVVFLKDGQMRGILAASSQNFALKTEEEQQATLYQFQNFLNTLDFSLQIVVHSRKLDIAPYLSYLEEATRKEDNELMKIQTQEYTEFIRSFVQGSTIMTKSFYVVVPFALLAGAKKTGGILSLFKTAAAPAKTLAKMSEKEFQAYKNQLDQRMDQVAAGLTRTGTRTISLDADSLTELFYEIYNPGEVKQKPREIPE
ncbi:MAG: hypothetical protein HYV52_02045 [Parcubacteria group bacterium]|nr:hypothetical protein [Parcubacteria group bacterium]